MAHSDSPIHPFDEISAKYNLIKKTPHPIDNQTESTTKSLYETKSFYINPPFISPESIGSPALIIDKDLRLIWQNSSAEQQLWPGIDSYNLLKNQDDIFEMLLTKEFQQAVSNWRQWVGFFIQQSLLMVSMEELEKIFNAKQDPQNEVLLALLSDYSPDIIRDNSPLHIHQILRNNQIKQFSALGITCDAGRLIVLQPEAEVKTGVSRIDSRSCYISPKKGGHYCGQETKSAFSVLVAQLNKSDTLSCEMLDVEYGRLLKRLSEIVKGTIEGLEGLFSQYEASKLIGYFFPNDEKRMDTYNVIQCALKLKHQMEDLSREWKIKKGWLHSIELNIGIEFGYNYISVMPSSMGENCIVLGNSLPAATFFSSIAKDGQIWVSKQIIDQFPKENLDALRFGIFRNDHSQQMFIPNCFSKIADLHTIQSISPPMDDELIAKPVTQIFDFLT